MKKVLIITFPGEKKALLNELKDLGLESEGVTIEDFYFKTYEWIREERPGMIIFDGRVLISTLDALLFNVEKAISNFDIDTVKFSIKQSLSFPGFRFIKDLRSIQSLRKNKA